jgi:hypothetical protein
MLNVSKIFSTQPLGEIRNAKAKEGQFLSWLIGRLSRMVYRIVVFADGTV